MRYIRRVSSPLATMRNGALRFRTQVKKKIKKIFSEDNSKNLQCCRIHQFLMALPAQFHMSPDTPGPCDAPPRMGDGCCFITPIAADKGSVRDQLYFTGAGMLLMCDMED